MPRSAGRYNGLAASEQGPHSIRVTQNGVEHKQNMTVKAGLELYLTVQFHEN